MSSSVDNYANAPRTMQDPDEHPDDFDQIFWATYEEMWTKTGGAKVIANISLPGRGPRCTRGLRQRTWHGGGESVQLGNRPGLRKKGLQRVEREGRRADGRPRLSILAAGRPACVPGHRLNAPSRHSKHEKMVEGREVGIIYSTSSKSDRPPRSAFWVRS
jgi:hypothetical protein